MNQKSILCLLLTMIYGLVSFSQLATAAQQPVEESNVYSLGEIVVSGKTEGVQASETVYTVTSEDIQNKDARTLDQAISLLPGVNVRVGGEGVPRIDVRGFRTRHVLLLLNGIPLNSAVDGQFDPTIIPTENIAKIKMTTGSSSVLYGQGGLGAVINIVTKKGTEGFKGMISGETGDHEPYLGRASISGAKDKLNFFLSGSASKINDFPLSDDFTPTSEQGRGYRNNSDHERNNVFGNVGVSPNKDLNLGFSFSYSEGNYGKPSSVINDQFDIFANKPKYERIDNFQGITAQLAADYQVTDDFSIRGWAFYNQLDQQDNLYDNANFNSFNNNGSFREQINSYIKGISVQPKYDLKKAGVVTLSLASERDTWKNNGVVTGNTFDPNVNQSYNIYSASIEYDVTPLENLGLVVGYGHYWQTRSNMNEDDYSVLAGAYYDLFKDTRLKASFKRDVRFPSLDDLFNLTQGNPNLAPEHSYTYQGGVEQKLPLDSVISITGFYTVAKNLIQNDQATSMNQNLAEVDFDGFELAAATKFVKKLLLRGSYTYLDSKDKSRAGRDQQQYTPQDKVTLEGKYDFDCGFSPYASLLYVGDQYFYTKNNVTPVQKLKLDDYVLVNVKLGQKLLDGKINLYVGVDNIFDKNYETSYGFPQPGRFIYGGIEFSI
jgi:vitamin B12 transporter